MKQSYAPMVSSAGYVLLTRIMLTTVFWAAAIGNTANYEEFASTVAGLGLPQPSITAPVVLVLLALGSLLIIANKYVTLASLGLGAFTLLTIPVAHPFWALSGAERLAELRIALEHVSLVGGLMAFTSLSEGRNWSEARSSADFQSI